MKALYYLIFLFSLPFFSCNNQKKTLRVLDQENILTIYEVNKLDSLYNNHERITSNEIALFVSPDYVPDSTILAYATRMGNKFGVGKRSTDNGVVILVCPRQRQVAIATGLGTEKVLTNEIAKRIIDESMIPRFSEGKFFEAVWDGSLAVTKFLELPGHKVK